MKQGVRPTLKAIARRLGVSVTTVSRALNGKAAEYGISKKTEEAVRRAAKRLHFSPDPLARGLRLNRTLSIGLLIPDVSNPYFAEIAKNVEMAARGGGYSAILALSNLIALGILRALSEEGLEVPEDISIICFDDQPYCAYLDPPLTTVDQSNEQMGQIAVRLLLEHIQSARGLRQEGVVLPTRLIKRASVRRIGKRLGS